MYAAILYTLMQFLILLSVSNIYCSILPKKDAFQHPFFICSLYYFVISITGNVLRISHPLLLSLLVTIPHFLFCIFFFKGDLFHRISAGGLALLGHLMIEYSSSCIFSLLNWLNPLYSKTPIQLFNENDQNHALLMLLFCAVIAALAPLITFPIIRLLKYHFMCMNTKIILQLVLPIAVSLVLSNITYYLSNANFLFSLFYWITTFLILYMLHCGLNNLTRLEEDMYLLQRRQVIIKLQLEYSRSLNQEYDMIRRWNHDYQNHLFVLSYLVTKEDTESVKKYLDDLLEKEMSPYES